MTSTEDRSNDWFCNAKLPFWGYLAKRILELHEIPKHVAFVMDGNRRYARRKNMSSVVKGHSKGFEQMTKVLDWCRQLNVKEVTLFAFSIDNFKRDEAEVSGLMQLAETQFLKLLQEKDKLANDQICFRFLGNTSLLPKRIQQLIAEIETLTTDYKKGFVNVCLSYSSRDEIARAMEWIRRGVQSNLIREEDISSKLITNCLDSRYSMPVDLLIRTSGERRLSDFLLWQCSNSYVHFEDVLWPDLSFWHLIKAIVGFQRSRSLGVKLMEDPLSTAQGCAENNRVKNFLKWMNEERTGQRLMLHDK